MPDSEKRLRRQLVKAKELRAQALKEIDQLKADNEALVGALHQVVMENDSSGSNWPSNQATFTFCPPSLNHLQDDFRGRRHWI